MPRENVVVATKVFGETGPGPNARGASRGHILDGVKASLKRLQLDHIDLYQIHGFDPATPIEETVRALDQLVRQGHVRYVGVSNWAAWQIVKALGIAERLGLARFESLQAYYTIAGRDLERELIPMLQQRRRRPDGVEPARRRPAERQVRARAAGEAGSRRTSFDFPPVNRIAPDDCIDAMRPIAQAHGVSVAQVALAWLLHQPQVTSVIIGAKRPEQLADNLAATQLTLSAAELAAARRGQPPAGRVPGLDVRAPGRVPAQADARSAVAP